ncbi:MAG: MBL fold metallo-hydrolase [Lachnospiraceae bacterium]|nr:MBL fold metallo-hydrolase [Lachnospiraceae bacterium]
MDSLLFCSQLYTDTEELQCRHGARLLLIRDEEASAFYDLGRKFCDLGYQCFAEHREGDVLFATYVMDEETLNISYTPFEQMIRVIRDEGTALPPDRQMDSGNYKTTDAIDDGVKVVPLVTQIHQRYWEHDCGMTYLIRLGDGRFAIIDGGMAETGETEHLLSLLREQNVLGGVPRIAVWFFTHAHIDHFNGFVKLMELYRAEVELESICYSWLNPEKSKGFSRMETFEETVSRLMEEENPPKLIRPRSGQRFIYPGVVFDVLFTCEDLYPADVPNLNDSSLVMRMTAGEHRVFWAADMQGQAAAYMAQKYPKEVLQCDILQVPHHGYWGASDELYEMINPEILLWPCPGFRYPEILYWDCNHFFRESPNVCCTYVAGIEETTLDMTRPVPVILHFEQKGDILYEEDFHDTDAYRVFWDCIRGRSQVYYKSYALSFPADGGCRLSAGEDICVCEWAHTLRMENAPDYRLVFSGTAEGTCEKVGLFWNYETPRIWDEEKLLRIPMTEGIFQVELIADSKAGKAWLFYNGEPAAEVEYVPERWRSICLVMQNGSIVVDHILITKR